MEMQKQEEKTQPLTSSFYPQFPPPPPPPPPPPHGGGKGGEEKKMTPISKKGA